MNNKFFTVIALAFLAILASLFISSDALAANKSSDGTKGVGGAGVSNIENQTVIFEGTDLGKYRAEWSKDRTIKPCDSIQNYNPAFSRGTQPPKCDKK